MAKSYDTYMAESGQQSQLDALRKSGGYEAAKKAYGGGSSTPSTTSPPSSSSKGKDYGGWYDNPAQGNKNMRWWGEGVWTMGDEPGAPKSAEQVTSSLNQFQNDLFKSQNRPEVRTPSMEEIKKETAPEGKLPELVDWTKKLEDYREEFGVAETEKSLNEVKAAIRETEATKRIRAKAEEGKTVATNVIAGRVTEIERQENERLDFLSRQGQRITDELNTQYNVINMYMETSRMTYTDAVERYDSEFKQNLSMYEIVLGQEMASLDQWNKDRTIAIANLQTYANAVTSGNLDLSSLSGDQKLQISKLEAQSGLPIGFISSLKMSPQDQLLNINDKTGEALMMGADGKFKVVQTGMRPTPSTGTAGGAKAELQGAYGDAEEWLKEKGGDDLFVSPDEWKEIRSVWARAGYNVKDFDSSFKDRFVGNPETRGWSSSLFGYENPKKEEED